MSTKTPRQRKLLKTGTNPKYHKPVQILPLKIGFIFFCLLVLFFYLHLIGGGSLKPEKGVWGGGLRSGKCKRCGFGAFMQGLG